MSCSRRSGAYWKLQPPAAAVSVHRSKTGPTWAPAETDTDYEVAPRVRGEKSGRRPGYADGRQLIVGMTETDQRRTALRRFLHGYRVPANHAP